MPTTMRFLPALTLAAILTSTGTLPRPAVGVAGQRRERIVVLKHDFDPPVKIKAVRLDGKPIKTDEKFLADDDWLEGLSVSVKNETAKAIVSIGVDVLFLRPEEQAKEPPYVYKLGYGPDPFLLKPGEEYQTNLPPTPPGEMVAMFIPADHYNDIKSSLSELGYPSPHKGIEIRIASIGFSDGTFWHSGSYYRRDPTTPSGWKEIEAPSGSARKGAANFFCLQAGGLYARRACTNTYRRVVQTFSCADRAGRVWC